LNCVEGTILPAGQFRSTTEVSSKLRSGLSEPHFEISEP
jgi:hypothetical protein